MVDGGEDAAKYSTNREQAHLVCRPNCTAVRFQNRKEVRRRLYGQDVKTWPFGLVIPGAKGLERESQ